MNFGLFGSTVFGERVFAGVAHCLCLACFQQAHLPIWEEGVCMELRAHPDLHTYGPGGDFGLAPTELRVCVYAYSEFASGQLLVGRTPFLLLFALCLAVRELHFETLR